MTRANAPRFKKLRSLYNWHRYVGLTAAALVLVLAITGIMLNHTNALKLDSRHVSSTWLLDWYGIQAPQLNTAYRAGEHWVSQWDQTVYLDGKGIANKAAPLRGALRSDNYLLIATSETLWLFTPQGDLIEHISAAHGLPTPVERLGRAEDGSAIILTPRDSFHADVDRLEWTPRRAEQIHWSEPRALPDRLHNAIRGDSRRGDLNWERVTLDLHSGRILGTAGVLIMDAAAILLIFLALSGFMLWWIRRRKQRQHQRAAHRAQEISQ